MTSLNQEVDSIIAAEGIDNSIPAVAPDDTNDTPPENNDTNTPPDDNKPDDTSENKPEEKPEENTPDEENKNDAEEKPEEPKIDTSVPNVDVGKPQDANTFLQGLNLTDDKVFTESGDVKEFREVVNIGEYLANEVPKLTFTGKDGKQYEFRTLKDVEDQFPDGFEAKNNIEQLKFNSAILSNEAKFKNAVETLKSAEEQYTKETNAIVQARSDNDRIGKEYRAMAEQGLVPKVEGDPSDPKFLEQPAIKELDKILNWMETKNKELREKGLGQINSVYVAKQLMDTDTNKSSNDDKKNEIINQREEAASISNTPPSDGGNKKQTYSNIPMSRLADEIIAQEGLR